jgi:hypothetical protein
VFGLDVELGFGLAFVKVITALHFHYGRTKNDNCYLDYRSRNDISGQVPLHEYLCRTIHWRET